MTSLVFIEGPGWMKILADMRPQTHSAQRTQGTHVESGHRCIAWLARQRPFWCSRDVFRFQRVQVVLAPIPCGLGSVLVAPICDFPTLAQKWWNEWWKGGKHWKSFRRWIKRLEILNDLNASAIGCKTNDHIEII